MSNRNIQMKNKNDTGDWDNLFPVTLDSNVLNPNGESVNDHVKKTEIHRPIHFDDNPNVDNYNDNDVILTPYREIRSGHVLLDEKSLAGRVDTGIDLLVSPEFRGKIKRYEIEVYGAIERENTPTPLIVLVDGDTGENYRSTIFRWSTDESDDNTSQRVTTSFPYTVYMGRYLSQANITLLPQDQGDTGYVTWTANSWPHEGAVSRGYISQGGGRWSGDSVTIRRFTVKTSYSGDVWTPASWARLWGVL